MVWILCFLISYFLLDTANKPGVVSYPFDGDASNNNTFLGRPPKFRRGYDADPLWDEGLSDRELHNYTERRAAPHVEDLSSHPLDLNADPQRQDYGAFSSTIKEEESKDIPGWSMVPYMQSGNELVPQDSEDKRFGPSHNATQRRSLFNRTWQDYSKFLGGGDTQNEMATQQVPKFRHAPAFSRSFPSGSAGISSYVVNGEPNFPSRSGVIDPKYIRGLHDASFSNTEYEPRSLRDREDKMYHTFDRIVPPHSISYGEGVHPEDVHTRLNRQIYDPTSSRLFSHDMLQYSSLEPFKTWPRPSPLENSFYPEFSEKKNTFHLDSKSFSHNGAYQNFGNRLSKDIGYDGMDQPLFVPTPENLASPDVIDFTTLNFNSSNDASATENPLHFKFGRNILPYTNDMINFHPDSEGVMDGSFDLNRENLILNNRNPELETSDLETVMGYPSIAENVYRRETLGRMSGKNHYSNQPKLRDDSSIDSANADRSRATGTSLRSMVSLVEDPDLDSDLSDSFGYNTNGLQSYNHNQFGDDTDVPNNLQSSMYAENDVDQFMNSVPYSGLLRDKKETNIQQAPFPSTGNLKPNVHGYYDQPPSINGQNSERFLSQNAGNSEQLLQAPVINKDLSNNIKTDSILNKALLQNYNLISSSPEAFPVNLNPSKFNSNSTANSDVLGKVENQNLVAKVGEKSNNADNATNEQTSGEDQMNYSREVDDERNWKHLKQMLQNEIFTGNLDGYSDEIISQTKPKQYVPENSVDANDKGNERRSPVWEYKSIKSNPVGYYHQDMGNGRGIPNYEPIRQKRSSMAMYYGGGGMTGHLTMLKKMAENNIHRAHRKSEREEQGQLQLSEENGDEGDNDE